MKIYTLTFSGCYNYGAILQCYALQKCIKEYGADTKVVDLQLTPETYKRKKTMSKYGLKMLIFDLTHINRDIQFKRATAKFERFRSEYIDFTEPVYSVDALPEVTKEIDACVVGSDQVWNPLFQDRQN